jgi:predicted ester cyclase
MSEQNKALIQRWFEEVWNQGNSKTIDELLDENGVIHGLADASGQPVRGLQAFHDFHDQFRGAFSGLYVSVDDVIAEGDRVVARCSVRGKHTGESLGFAATNAPIQFEGIAIVRIKDGKIVEAWNQFDFLEMNKQLGVL